MKYSPFKLNNFILFKIPSAYISGVRVAAVTKEKVTVRVRYRWINQNPFKSMYWATQGMASELATGLLLMQAIEASSRKISMLVVGQSGEFYKKAVGKIIFESEQTFAIQQAIDRTVESGEGQKIVLCSNGIDEEGEIVSKFEYEWSIKLKK